MEIRDLPLDADERAMADIADVTDWTKLAGPKSDDAGYDVVKEMVQRVTAATDWKPWPDAPGTNYDNIRSWGFETSRGTTMIVTSGLVFADTQESGFSLYDLTPADVPQAERELDKYFPEVYLLALKAWGPAVWVSDRRTNPDFEDELWEGAGFDRRHMAVWLRDGAKYILYSDQPTADPLSESVGINYAVYLD